MTAVQRTDRETTGKDEVPGLQVTGKEEPASCGVHVYRTFLCDGAVRKWRRDHEELGRCTADCTRSGQTWRFVSNIKPRMRPIGANMPKSNVNARVAKWKPQGYSAEPRGALLFRIWNGQSIQRRGAQMAVQKQNFDFVSAHGEER